MENMEKFRDYLNGLTDGLSKEIEVEVERLLRMENTRIKNEVDELRMQLNDKREVYLSEKTDLKNTLDGLEKRLGERAVEFEGLKTRHAQLEDTLLARSKEIEEAWMHVAASEHEKRQGIIRGRNILEFLVDRNGILKNTFNTEKVEKFLDLDPVKMGKIMFENLIAENYEEVNYQERFRYGLQFASEPYSIEGVVIDGFVCGAPLATIDKSFKEYKLEANFFKDRENYVRSLEIYTDPVRSMKKLEFKDVDNRKKGYISKNGVKLFVREIGKSDSLK